jgi:hypothetical protein
MPGIYIFPGVTAPGFAVLTGAALVYAGLSMFGVGFVLAGLLAWLHVN